MQGISIIICTYNGEHTLKYALDYLSKQDIQKDIRKEIIIIDNGSTDNTSKIAQNYLAKHNIDFEFRLLYEKNIGKSNALIMGYNKAKYELMLVCDDDNYLNPNYLQTVYNIFHKNHEIALLGGYGIGDFRNEEKPEWFDDWEQVFACGKYHEKSGFLKSGNASIWGAGSVLKKSIWENIREAGFNFLNNKSTSDDLGEDVELSHAVMFSGAKLYFDEKLWFYHDMSGGRVTKKNKKNQIKRNGSELFPVYAMTYQNCFSPNKKFELLYLKMIFSMSINLIANIINKNNKAKKRLLLSQFIKFTSQRKKLKKVYFNILPWIRTLKEAYPQNKHNI